MVDFSQKYHLDIISLWMGSQHAALLEIAYKSYHMLTQRLVVILRKRRDCSEAVNSCARTKSEVILTEDSNVLTLLKLDYVR